MNLADATTYMAKGTYEEGLSWIGREVTRVAPYAINQAQIGYYCALIEDKNENYWDPAVAKARFGSPLSPPGLLLTWLFPLPWLPTGRPEHGPVLALEVPLPGSTLINVATDTTFHSPMRVGSTLQATERVVTVSPSKKTALGVGHFVTTVAEVSDDSGVLVATNENVLYRYEASASAAKTTPTPASRQPAGDVESADRSDFPVTRMPITLSRCVLNAAATRDFFPGHHDRDYAQNQAAKDVYLNTMFFQGFFDRLLTDWTGPDAWILRRQLKMMAPACVGETLATSGAVTQHQEKGRHLVKVKILASTEQGPVAVADIAADLDGWPGAGSGQQ